MRSAACPRERVADRFSLSGVCYLLVMWCVGSLLALLAAVAQTLVLRELRVPPLVDIRDNVTLVCRFDLGHERLYSVKWYKDEFEFYRYIPDNHPPCQALPVSGVTLLDEAGCHMETVTLTRLTPNSSGGYRCEVSTEAPSFQTVYKTSNMTVVALPLKEPTVEGAQASYTIGDIVRVLCVSDKSNPPAHLAWFINGIKADRQQVELIDAALPMDDQDLHIRTLSLSFVVEKHFFTEDGQMELRCVATVGDRTQSTVITSCLRTASNLGLAQERTVNSAHTVLPSTSTTSITLLLYVCWSVR
ncbi:uncharacterized protein [Anabrus simplex]|uniref:uncharacterized protein n=1 Tax=Anabrus simplex TaxID=316456 RepID=UPI0035A31BB0